MRSNDLFIHHKTTHQRLSETAEGVWSMVSEFAFNVLLLSILTFIGASGVWLFLLLAHPMSIVSVIGYTGAMLWAAFMFGYVVKYFKKAQS